MSTITNVKSSLTIETFLSEDKVEEKDLIITTNLKIPNENSTQSLTGAIQDSICSHCGSKEDLKEENQGPNSIHLTRREIQLLRQSWAIMLLDLPEESSVRFYDVLNHKDTLAVYLLFDESKDDKPENEFDEADHCNFLSRDQILLSTITPSIYEDSLFCTELYENLVELQKEKHGKFTSIREQVASFGHIVNECIQNIDHLDKFNKKLQTISKRHGRIWGSDTAQFKIMGDALLNTLEDRFGSLFTSELEDYWIQLFTHILNTFAMYKDDPTVFTAANMKENRHWKDYNIFGGLVGVDYLEFPIPRYLDEEEEDDDDDSYVYFNFLPKTSSSKSGKNNTSFKPESETKKYGNVYNIKTGMTESIADSSLRYNIFDKTPSQELATSESASNCGTIQGMSKHKDCIIM
ncbi:hypothetical protein MOUN0_O13344 [Monosporozyma unispora]